MLSLSVAPYLLPVMLKQVLLRTRELGHRWASQAMVMRVKFLLYSAFFLYRC
ncbi:hypothetical protein B296_00052978, partial [Ensete ventricosum]